MVVEYLAQHSTRTHAKQEFKKLAKLKKSNNSEFDRYSYDIKKLKKYVYHDVSQRHENPTTKPNVL